jgi:hypothetical protein
MPGDGIEMKSMDEASVCPLCEKEFVNKRDKFRHLDRWGCPIASRVLAKEFAPLCACGCGNKVQLNKRNPKYYNKYVQGHNKRVKLNT